MVFSQYNTKNEEEDVSILQQAGQHSAVAARMTADPGVADSNPGHMPFVETDHEIISTIILPSSMS